MVIRPHTQATALWKEHYRSRTFLRAEVARMAPSQGLVISTASGTGQLYAWDVTSGTLKMLTQGQEGVFTGLLSPDGVHVYYLRDEAGSEVGHYTRISWKGGEKQDITPEMPPYAALYRCAVSSNGTLFAFTPTEAHGFPLYCLDLSSDKTMEAPRELYRSPKLIDDVTLSSNAEMVVVATTELSQTRQYSLLAFNIADGKRVGGLTDIPQGSIRAVMFSPLPGDLRLLCMADRTGCTRPLIWNIKSGERIGLPLEDLAGDVEPLDWSLDGKRILLNQVSCAIQQIFTYDLEAGTLTPLEHPRGSYGGAHFALQDQIVALWTDTTHPPQVVALDSYTGTFKGTLLSTGKAPPARPFTSVSFRSSDDTEIQGWLGLPEGTGPFPTILAVHGGPHSVVREAYNPDGQAWLDHGYAYLTINYRGSMTFGRAFKEQIWGDMGHWELEDMAAAHAWLVREKIAQPDAILVTGGSYGGYLTLMALSKQPELWVGGMALVAPADFTSGFVDGTDWFRGYLTAMMGGTPQEKPKQYVDSSPLTYVAQVVAPLLVIQGRNDLRCPPRQMELYAEKMFALGKPFEINWFDAGHGGLETEQLIAFQERMLDFAYHIVSRKAGTTSEYQAHT